MTSSDSDDKSISIHSQSDDSREEGRDTSPEEYLTKGKGTTTGKGRARKPPAKKTTGKYPHTKPAIRLYTHV